MQEVIPFSETPVFRILKNSGENFFDNLNKLKDIKLQCSPRQLKSQETYQKKISEQYEPKIDKLVFSSIKFRDPPAIEYEKREECLPEDDDKIRKACLEKKDCLIYDLDTTVEKIKLSLGYKSKTQSGPEYKKPCVAVVGQTKSGKSSLLNCMMREIVVPQRQTRLTARITYLTYSEIKFVAYMRDKRLVEIKIGADIKKEDVDVAFEKRYKKDIVSIQVRVGCGNSILMNGFDIVDSPGLNENPALNDLCKRMEKSLLPLLIYVIDGRNGLTESDVADIKGIKEAARDLRIIYFVTKLDRSEVDFNQYIQLKKQKGIPDDKDMDGESEIAVADRRLDSVFQKLKKPSNDFVDSKINSVRNCSNLHGASLLYVNRVRISEKAIEKRQVEAYKYSVELFEKFEKKLMNELKDRLENPLVKDIESIQTNLSQILERITIIASDFQAERSLKMKCLEDFQDEENKFFENEKKFINEELFSKISSKVDACEKDLLSRHVDSRMTLENSEPFQHIKKKMNNEEEYAAFIKKIQINYTNMDEQLKKSVKEFLSDFMQTEDNRLRNNLLDLVQTLGKGKYGRTSFEEMLKERLFYEYDLIDNWVFSKNQDELFSESRRKVRQSILHKIDSMSVPKLSIEIPEKDESGQRTVRVHRMTTPEVDRQQFSNHIFDMIIEEIKERHKKFQDNLNHERSILERVLEVGETERCLLKSCGEELAYQYARTVEITTNMNYIEDPQKQDKSVKIDSGSQANIKAIYVINKEEPVVSKTYKRKFNPEKSTLKKIGFEVYYSSRLNSPRFLKLLGFKMDLTEEGMIKVSLFYPYLPLGSLEKYLHDHARELELKQRLQLALDISIGMKSLHDLKIMHCDLTLKNILVKKMNRNNQIEAVISDYGCLNSLGFVDSEDLNDSKRWEDSFFKATEIHNQVMRETCGPLYALDVFSFGFALWILLTYKLRSEYANYYPKLVIEVESVPDKVKKNILEGRRPSEEKRTLHPLREEHQMKLLNLMELCWHKDFNRRPSFTEKLKEVMMHSRHKDETIVNVLEQVIKEAC